MSFRVPDDILATLVEWLGLDPVEQVIQSMAEEIKFWRIKAARCTHDSWEWPMEHCVVCGKKSSQQVFKDGKWL